MTHKNYIIEYTAIAKDNTTLKKGKMRVKNNMSEFEAKVKLERLFKKNYNSFEQLIIYNCYEDKPFNNIFNNIFNETIK